MKIITRLLNWIKGNLHLLKLWFYKCPDKVKTCRKWAFKKGIEMRFCLNCVHNIFGVHIDEKDLEDKFKGGQND